MQSPGDPIGLLGMSLRLEYGPLIFVQNKKEKNLFII